MRHALFIVGFYAVQLVVCSGQAASNIEQILVAVHSNDLAFLNTNATDYASNFAAAYAAYRQGKVSKGALMILAQRAANAQPQDFYGRVIDQHGQPISGVAVTGNLNVMGGLGDGANNQTLTTQSDTNGLFQFTGIKGWHLGIVAKKAGYAMSLTKGPTGKTTNPNDRKIFTLWKLQGAEPLVSINQRYKFHYTDAPINFDLLAGKTVPGGGDIQIVMSRSPGVVSGRTRQNWGVQVAAVAGGLIEADGQEGITFEAPESGYQPSVSFVISTNAPYKWFGGFDQTFFLESRNGQVYSKVNFSITINQQPDDYVWVEFHGVASTNGSRNWEATVPKPYEN